MKKLMTAMAICAAASYSLAAGSVTSANVVGYKGNVSIFANYYTMIGLPFAPVGGGGTPIATMFADNSKFTASDTESHADTILVWNGVTYTHYYFSSDLEGQWTSTGDTVTTDTIPAGGAFWFRRVGAALNSLTLAGEVIKTNITTTVNANYYTMIGNPFAAALPIASITGPNLTASDTESHADTILVWTGVTYTHYYYSSDLEGKWTNTGDTETTDSIPSSGAFWFRRVGAASTLTLPVPYSL